MPIGVTLDVLRKELRAETGQALNFLLHGVQSQETQDIMLDRQQRELWDAYNWPHLRYSSDVELFKNQALYSYPAEMPFDQIDRVALATSSNLRDAVTGVVTTTWSGWIPLKHGIRALDIPPGPLPTGTPTRWDNNTTVTSGVTNSAGQLLLLPVPDFDQDQTDNQWTTMKIRLVGQAPCTSLASATDRCIIDSKAIVLFTAAEILAIQKSESAALKLTKAQNYLRKLLVNIGADKRGNFNMGGGAARIDHLARQPYANVPGIGYIP